MAQTSKLISTISYNTPLFLKGKVYDLVREGILEYGYWIWHEPESDETKQHAHLLVKPNRRLDTSALRNQFVEPVAGSDKPLGVQPFRASNRVGDWLLYCSHDAQYLIRKGQTRVHHYTSKDFNSTDEDLFADDWRECHSTTDSKIPLLQEMAENGVSWVEVLKMGFIPVNQLFQYKDIFFAFCDRSTNRNGRKGHED